ncbi:MAG TPA: hypothetical protein VGL61_16385 [Kofleriaceae bacterium]|jgi:hypothetical protein
MTSFVARMVTEKFHRDDEGRPLREGRTPPEFLKPDDLEYKTCPYAGRRFQHAKLMNVSALRQTSAHWDEIVGALAVVRSGYAGVRDYAPDAMDVMDIWRVSQLGSSLPWFFLFKRGAVPAYAAALAKATQGVGLWAQNMLVRTLTTGWQPPKFDAATMAADAEASGTLIGATELCSGSDKMLARFFETYVDGSPGTGELAEMRDDALAFGAHYASFKLLYWLYYLARRYILHELGTPEAKALLDAPCEPADFFVLEAPDAGKVPRPMRARWLHPLASLVVPFAPDRGDAPLAMAALQLAIASGLPGTPAETFVRLDEIFRAALARIEKAFGGSEPPSTDELIAPGTRAAFQLSR